MSVFRINKTKDYTVMSNKHLRDKALSFKAKGMLSVMLSLPDEWDYSISGLSAISKENEAAVKSGLDELKENGYLLITKLMPNETKSGRIEYIYDVFELPKQDGKKQGVEKQGVENQALENYPLNKNTNKVNTNKRSTKDSIIAQFASPAMQSAFETWLAYKAEKRQAYKPIGLKHLVAELNKKIAEIGEEAVIKGINQSMANCWQGIYYPKQTEAISKAEQGRRNIQALFNDEIFADGVTVE